ncbi:MAG: hypothetical protein POG74_03050 [Acidocella sp.]|nr:hypothetical protein [Acidocella sp.]
MRIILTALCLIMLTGCVSQVNITYYCDPIGAKIVEDKTGQIYDCPVTLSYQVSPAQQNAGSVTVDGLTAIWVSGAKTYIPSIVSLLANGPNQSLVFQRDPKAPGAYTDAEYALQLKSLSVSQGMLNVQQQQLEQTNQQNLNNAVANLARALTQHHNN